jgi:hypothetical protein
VSDFTQLLELAAHAEPRPRIIVGFPCLGHDFIAIHERPDSQRLLLIGRGAYEKLHSLAEIRVLQNASEWVEGIEVEFWNWTQHREITRAVFRDLGYGPPALKQII